VNVITRRAGTIDRLATPTMIRTGQAETSSAAINANFSAGLPFHILAAARRQPATRIGMIGANCNQHKMTSLPNVDSMADVAVYP
jgi:hypothetical protein